MKYKMLKKFEKSVKIGAISVGLASVVFMTPVTSMETKAVDITTVTEVSEDDIQDDNAGSRAIKATLYENYSANYGMYEESMDDLFFFYSNVGNGSFTSDPVKFDFPGNITYVVEKDGEEVKYKSGDEIKALGNYVVRLSAEMDGDTYTATFRFSLKEPMTTDDSDNTTQLPGVDEQDMNDFDLSEDDLAIDMNEQITDEQINELIEQSGANFNMDGMTGMSDGVAVNAYTGFVRTFEPTTMMYAFTLRSGEKIISNIPEGAIINGGVTLTIPADMTVTVYKDGDVLSGEQNLNFTDVGFYKVVFHSPTTNFYRFYPEDDSHPFITFRIVGAGVNDMEVFTAPAGCKIIGIYNNNGQFRDENGSAELDLESYWMEYEGEYNFIIYDPEANGSYEVRINRDVTAPKGYVDLTKSSAALYFESNDIGKIDVYRSGQQVPYEGPNFSGKGDYTLNVYDQSGNMTTITFTLKDAFNKGTFFTFLISFILIAAAFVYIRLQRTYIRTR